MPARVSNWLTYKSHKLPFYGFFLWKIIENVSAWIECKFSLHPLLNLNKSVPPRTNLLEKGLSPNSITSQRYYGLQRLWQSFFIELDRSRFFLESFTNENAYKEAAQLSSRLLVICSLPTHPFNLLLSFGQKASITTLFDENRLSDDLQIVYVSDHLRGLGVLHPDLNIFVLPENSSQLSGSRDKKCYSGW